MGKIWKLLKILTIRERKILQDLQNIEKNIELLKNPQNIEIIENIALYHLWINKRLKECDFLDLFLL